MAEQDGAMRVLAQAEGGSKKEAQQRAAELALVEWPAERLKESNGVAGRGSDGAGSEATG